MFECLDRDTNLERHISRDVEEDGVASPRGSHQDGDLLSLTRLLRWRLGFCLRGVRRGGVRGHSARGGIYCQKYLLCSNLWNLDTSLVQSLSERVGLVKQPLRYCFGYLSMRITIDKYKSLSCSHLLLVNLMGWYFPLVSITSSTTGLLPLVDCMGSLTLTKP